MTENLRNPDLSIYNQIMQNLKEKITKLNKQVFEQNYYLSIENAVFRDHEDYIFIFIAFFAACSLVGSFFQSAFVIGFFLNLCLATCGSYILTSVSRKFNYVNRKHVEKTADEVIALIRESGITPMNDDQKIEVSAMLINLISNVEKMFYIKAVPLKLCWKMSQVWYEQNQKDFPNT